MKEREITKQIKNEIMAPIKVTNLNLLYSELNNFKSKEEKLFGKKCFLEIILGLIKNSQNDIITNEIHKDKNISFVKKILKSLMKDLLEIKREKEKELNLNELIKKEKKNNFFNSNNSNKHIINSIPNNFETNFNALTTLDDENESYEELNQLKLLNFKVKNEITKTNNLIRKTISEINYYKNNSNKKKSNIIYINNNDKEIINQILHNKLIFQRKYFIKVANKKNEQDDYIKFLLDQIHEYQIHLKELYKLEEKNNILKKNKFFIETIVENTENDEISINNNNKYYEYSGFDNLNNKLIKDNNYSLKEINSNKDLTCNEETNCNTSEKNGVSVK